MNKIPLFFLILSVPGLLNSKVRAENLQRPPLKFNCPNPPITKSDACVHRGVDGLQAIGCHFLKEKVERANCSLGSSGRLWLCLVESTDCEPVPSAGKCGPSKSLITEYKFFDICMAERGCDSPEGPATDKCKAALKECQREKPDKPEGWRACLPMESVDFQSSVVEEHPSVQAK